MALKVSMKRGRRDQSVEFKTAITKVIKSSKTPLTIEAIRSLVSQKKGRTVSWNTIYKYLEELVGEGIIKKTELP